MKNTNKIFALFDAFEAMQEMGYEVYTFQLHFDTRTIKKLVGDMPQDSIIFDYDSLNMSMHTNQVRFLYKGNLEELELVLSINGIDIDVYKDGMVWFTIEDIQDIQSFFETEEKD